MTETGGSMPPFKGNPDLVVLASEGSALVSDDLVDRCGVEHLAEVGGIPAENVHRASDETWPAAWRPREQFAHLTYDEGGPLAPGVTFTDCGKPEPVFTAEQIERGRAWIRDHYRDGTFRCPGDGEDI